MKTARELYPYALKDDEWGDKCFLIIKDYQPILDSFGEILLQIDDNGYQGDSRVLYKLPNEIGILQFGWGSCSGCDALMDCDSYEEVDEFIQHLHSRILRYPSLQEAIEYFSTKRFHDGTLYDSSGNARVFFRQARQILRKMINTNKEFGKTVIVELQQASDILGQILCAASWKAFREGFQDKKQIEISTKIMKDIQEQVKELSLFLEL